MRESESGEPFRPAFKKAYPALWLWECLSRPLVFGSHGLVEQEGRMMWMGGRSVGAEAGRAQQSCP